MAISDSTDTQICFYIHDLFGGLWEFESGTGGCFDFIYDEVDKCGSDIIFIDKGWKNYSNNSEVKNMLLENFDKLFENKKKYKIY